MVLAPMNNKTMPSYCAGCSSHACGAGCACIAVKFHWPRTTVALSKAAFVSTVMCCLAVACVCWTCRMRSLSGTLSLVLAFTLSGALVGMVTHGELFRRMACLVLPHGIYSTVHNAGVLSGVEGGWHSVCESPSDGPASRHSAGMLDSCHCCVTLKFVGSRYSLEQRRRMHFTSR